jgi:2-dehydropantoate 2-reductase
VVVSVQNGLGNLELIRTLLPRTTIIGASVVYGARLIEPGHVEAAGSPRIRIGGAPADLDVADALAEAWTLAGLVSESVPDIGPVLLAKALLNAVINPITALHRAPNGAVVDDPDVKEVARRLAAECQAVWGATRPDGPVLDVWNSVEEVARNTATNRSSMLQDVEAGRPTEERAILGAVLELAQQHRIATPGLRDVRARIVAIGAKATRAS